MDNQVITSDGELFGAKWQKSSSTLQPTDASSGDGQPIWASLYERAYALSKGSYDAIGNGGYEGDALVDITGKKDNLTSIDLEAGAKTQEFSMSQNGKDSSIKKEEVFESIQTTLNQGGYAAAGSKDDSGKGSDKETLYNGVLYQNHAYSIHNAYENEAGQKLILLRNPHGSDNSSGENNKPVFATEDPNQDKNDGFITITFDAFIDNFGDLALLKA